VAVFRIGAVKIIFTASGVPLPGRKDGTLRRARGSGRGGQAEKQQQVHPPHPVRGISTGKAAEKSLKHRQRKR
jgi:hypothetical protein